MCIAFGAVAYVEVNGRFGLRVFFGHTLSMCIHIRHMYSLVVLLIAYLGVDTCCSVVVELLIGSCSGCVSVPT